MIRVKLETIVTMRVIYIHQDFEECIQCSCFNDAMIAGIVPVSPALDQFRPRPDSLPHVYSVIKVEGYGR